MSIGGASGVEVASLDVPLSPTMLRACTSKMYAVPFIRPVTVTV